MPNRILKESICTSEDIALLSQGAEILFYRLIVKADDYGVYLANPAIIRGSCFPLQSDDITISQMQEWLEELSSAGLVTVYSADDERKYLQFTKWDRHQQIRAQKPKYPLPESACNQLISDDSKCPRNPIQSNRIRESNTKADKLPRFSPPSVDEVAAYCREKKYSVDAQAFVDFYASKGWMVGKNKMQDWRAALRTWVRRQKDGYSNGTHTDDQGQYEERFTGLYDVS